MIYYLGIDAGGTSSSAMLFDEQGDRIAKFKKESMHYMRVGFEGISRILEDINFEIDQLNLDVSLLNVAIGMAGYGTDLSIRQSIENSVHSVFKDAFITNDAHFALIAALNDADGVYCISGTGSIAFKCEGDILSRKGGFGYLLDDEGSAYWIGRQLLPIFTKEDDGRLDKTTFHQAMLDHFKITEAYDLVSIDNQQSGNYRQWVANIALLGSKHTDIDYIKEIYVSAGRHLAAHANAFKIKGNDKLAVGGSVLNYNEIVKNSFLESLHSPYQFVEPCMPVEKSVYLIFNR